MKISIPKQEYEVNPEDLGAVEKFLSSIIPGFVKEFSCVLQDAVKGWRARNMVRILIKTKEVVEKSGLTQQELSGKFFVQALEKASMEDDENLQDRWAALLSNASTGRARADIKFVNILSELEADEAKLLAVLHAEQITKKSDKEYVFSSEKAGDAFNIPIKRIKVMVDHFYRLGICGAPAMTSISTGDKDTHPSLKTNMLFTFTDLGLDFLDSVRT